MKVSFIVCAYNEQKNIGNIIGDFLKEFSLVSGHELLIIDNDSEDKTFNTAAEYLSKINNNDNLIRLVRIRHCGLCESRNTAAEIADGDYVVYVDADARLSDEFVRKLISDIKTNKPEIIYGRVNNLNGAGRISRFFYQTLIAPSYNSLEKPFIGAFMGFNRERLNQIGFKAGLKRGDDTLILEEFKRFGEANIFFTQSAFVQNEFPESILIWLRNIFREGFYGCTIIKYLQLKKRKSILLLSALILMIICVITGQILFCLPYLLRIGLLIKNLAKQLPFVGYINLIASLLLLVVTILIRDIGFVLGSTFGPNITFERKLSEVKEVVKSSS